MNIIIDSDFASRHAAPSQLDIIFHVKLSGPHQVSERISEGLARAIKASSERRKRNVSLSQVSPLFHPSTKGAAVVRGVRAN